MKNQKALEGRWTDEFSAPPVEAIHVERVVDPFTQVEAIGMVRHPGRPFCAPAPSPADRNDPDGGSWRKIGFDYLKALGKALNLAPGHPQWLHPKVLRALDPSQKMGECCFSWLRTTWEGRVTAHRLAEDTSPLGSFWVDRVTGAQRPIFPRLMVLMAGNVVGEHRLQMGRDIGLRIVIHVHEHHVRIYGATLSGLSHDGALRVVPTPRRQDRGNIYGLVVRIKEAIGSTLKCGKHVWIANLERTLESGAPPTRLSASGYALRWRRRKAQDEVAWGADRPVRAKAYDFRVDVDVDPKSGRVTVVQVHRDEYVGSGARSTRWTRARAFVMDPASQHPAATLRKRRPTLTDDKLDKFRVDVDVDLAIDGELRWGGASGLFETRSASDRDVGRLGGRTVTQTKKSVVAMSPVSRSRSPGPTGPVIRSDEHASIETHLRASELFARLQAYGIDAHSYFRFARLPLVQRARPEMIWAPDGELPNAEVRPFLGDADTDKKPPKASDRLQLLVKYGSADPMHRRKLPMFDTTGPRLKAQYLSVACDPRWAWHEFGHVLNFASTGELEFPFAHSAGDALGAIAADPLSALATAKDPEAPIRFASFPWIEVPGRSHGRSAEAGYGWCSCRNLVRLNFTSRLERYHHSYYGEQLMSSSLFRLYRALGGDTRGRRGDEDVRLEASDYCIYLIMRGVSLLGPDALAPARTADQLVSALIDADLGTGKWMVDAVWPFNRDVRPMSRHGGRVHKVIRWAFERQGLYATDDPRAAVEGPGQPPLVDVYIADQREPSSQPDGGYSPVPLRPTSDEPWHARRDWLMRSGRTVKVKVANRGSRLAQGVTLRAWWGVSTKTDAPELWRPLQVDNGEQRIGGGAETIFTTTLPVEAPSRGLWLFVSADAVADASNLELRGEPPSQMRELLELVAHDNNLALARR
jgi:hypothetical protein